MKYSAHIVRVESSNMANVKKLIELNKIYSDNASMQCL